MEERMSLKEMFIASRQELKKTSTLTITAVMIGLSAVLSMFTIVASQYLKISLFYLPVAVVGMLFGPVVSGLA
ncbi:MAG: folate family ECF transporter S component, partial [Peptococcaceae bacterium]|nr:folate family ECF transporter S component [Peptococcaceae bacterium]